MGIKLANPVFTEGDTKVSKGVTEPDRKYSLNEREGRNTIELRCIRNKPISWKYHYMCREGDKQVWLNQTVNCGCRSKIPRTHLVKTKRGSGWMKIGSLENWPSSRSLKMYMTKQIS